MQTKRTTIILGQGNVTLERVMSHLTHILLHILSGGFLLTTAEMPTNVAAAAADVTAALLAKSGRG